MVTTRAQGGAVKFKYRQGYAEVRISVTHAATSTGPRSGSSVRVTAPARAGPTTARSTSTEIYGSKPDISESNFHRRAATSGPRTTTSTTRSRARWAQHQPAQPLVAGGTNSWHTYGINWTANRSIGTSTGSSVRTYNATSSADLAALGYEHSIILNLAMGGDGPRYSTTATPVRTRQWLQQRQPERRPARRDGGRLREGVAALARAPIARRNNGANPARPGLPRSRVGAILGGSGRWGPDRVSGARANRGSRRGPARGRVLGVLTLGAFLGLLLGGIGPDAPRPAPPARAPIRRRCTSPPPEWTPPSVQVDPGQTVIWINESGAKRSIVADDSSFDSGPLRQGDRFQFAFTEPGTVDLHDLVRARGVGHGGRDVRSTPTAPIPVTGADAARPPPAAPTDFAYTGAGTARSPAPPGRSRSRSASASSCRPGASASWRCSGFSYFLDPDDLLPTRRHRRVRRARARRGQYRSDLRQGGFCPRSVRRADRPGAQLTLGSRPGRPGQISEHHRRRRGDDTAGSARCRRRPAVSSPARTGRHPSSLVAMRAVQEPAHAPVTLNVTVLFQLLSTSVPVKRTVRVVLALPR